MNDQPDLFPAPTERKLYADTPRARRTDPEPSHAAADEVKASGALACQQSQVLEAIRQFPGSTSAELAAKLNGDAPDPVGATYHTVARRAPELVPIYVRRGKELRVCSITGRPATTWWPTESWEIPQ